VSASAASVNVAPVVPSMNVAAVGAAVSTSVISLGVKKTDGSYDVKYGDKIVGSLKNAGSSYMISSIDNPNDIIVVRKNVQISSINTNTDLIRLMDVCLMVIIWFVHNYS
jgi:hypothetical protein